MPVQSKIIALIDDFWKGGAKKDFDTRPFGSRDSCGALDFVGTGLQVLDLGTGKDEGVKGVNR